MSEDGEEGEILLEKRLKEAEESSLPSLLAEWLPLLCAVGAAQQHLPCLLCVFSKLHFPALDVLLHKCHLPDSGATANTRV